MVASLLRGFAHHRKAQGDSWLPRDVYDEELWDIDGVYLYIITDGNVGGPRPAPRKPPEGDGVAALCDPSAPRDERMLAEAKAHVLATAAKPPADGPLTFASLLDELALTRLASTLADLSLPDVATAIAADRPAFLARLKTLGVERLADRQAVVNGVAKAQRAGRVPASS